MPNMSIFTSEMIDVDGVRKVEVTTNKCMVCNETGKVILTSDDWKRYHDRPEQFIQNTLLDATPDEREQILTGIHGPCFDSMFPIDDDGSESLCHCGLPNLHATSAGKDHNYSLRFYCAECADNRCDTSEGMEAGCPNG